MTINDIVQLLPMIAVPLAFVVGTLLGEWRIKRQLQKRRKFAADIANDPGYLKAAGQDVKLLSFTDEVWVLDGMKTIRYSLHGPMEG